MSRSLVITGASSGIGRALAIHYSGPGTSLCLIGRHRGRLSDVAAECQSRGSSVTSAMIDVRDRVAMRDFISAFDSSSPIDLLIANAGVVAGTQVGGTIEPADEGYALLNTNILGVVNAVHPVLGGMLTRGRGTVALMSSLAAFVPLPDAPSYSASKSAVLAYGLALRHLLLSKGIQVTVICPGFVDTPMSDQETGRQPFKMSAEKAARVIGRGIERGQTLIVFPRIYGWLTRLAGILPVALQGRVLASSRFALRPVVDPDRTR